MKRDDEPEGLEQDPAEIKKWGNRSACCHNLKVRHNIWDGRKLVPAFSVTRCGTCGQVDGAIKIHVKDASLTVDWIRAFCRVYRNKNGVPTIMPDTIYKWDGKGWGIGRGGWTAGDQAILDDSRKSVEGRVWGYPSGE